jgi:hypothetical protein
MDPLLHHLGTAAWLWLPVIVVLGILHAARARPSGSGGRPVALAVAATGVWMGLVLAAAWLGEALGGRPGLVLALLATMLVPFAALAHPRVRGLVEPPQEHLGRAPPAPDGAPPWTPLAGSNRRR